jgi:hydrogenase nickel incorporation protein HypA/HybF
MHELSVASAVLNTVLKHADKRRVSVVALRVGRMRQVIPDSLRFYWDIVARDTVCQDATLELDEIQTTLRCRDCRRRWWPQIPAFRCPQCGSADVDIEAGEELEVDYIEVEEQEAACTAPR